MKIDEIIHPKDKSSRTSDVIGSKPKGSDRLSKEREKRNKDVLQGKDHDPNRDSDMLKTESLDVATPSPEAIAHKHGVKVDDILDQLRQGIQVELEHTTDQDVAREIALDHLNELPDYYTRLRRMERS
jgi:hypothetical protein